MPSASRPSPRATSAASTRARKASRAPSWAMASDVHRAAMSAQHRAGNWQTSIESRYRSGAIRLAALLSVAIIVFAGWAALNPQPMAWLYVVLVAGFEMWLVRRIRAVGFAPVPQNEPPYDFSGDEADIVSRYRFYFAYPA